MYSVNTFNIMKCTICDKKVNFRKGESPNITKELWDQIVKHYGMEIYESEAESRRLKQTELRWIDENHLIICKECMEKALGRPLVVEEFSSIPQSENPILMRLKQSAIDNNKHII